MSKKQLACMLTLQIVYLFLGASIFYHVENNEEMIKRAEEKLERLEIQSKSLPMLGYSYLQRSLKVST
jgi:hypothetical protein